MSALAEILLSLIPLIPLLPTFFQVNRTTTILNLRGPPPSLLPQNLYEPKSKTQV